MTLNPRETATILAALRWWQAGFGMQAVGFDAIATNEFSFAALDMGEIDALCERLNAAPEGEAVKVVSREEWPQFLIDNAEHFISEFGPKWADICFNAARHGGLMVGGGAAPLVRVMLRDKAEVR
jgi:hypothetical protein